MPNYTTLIQNGKIIDGSGNPWFYGDVALQVFHSGTTSIKEKECFVSEDIEEHSAPKQTNKRTNTDGNRIL